MSNRVLMIHEHQLQQMLSKCTSTDYWRSSREVDVLLQEYRQLLNSVSALYSQLLQPQYDTLIWCTAHLAPSMSLRTTCLADDGDEKCQLVERLLIQKPNPMEKAVPLSNLVVPTLGSTKSGLKYPSYRPELNF